MKLAITSTGKELDSNLDPRFGRAAYFIMVDPKTMAFEVVENSQNLNLSWGAGIQASKTIVDNHVDVLITGNCGPKAFMVLERAGIKIVTGASGTITENIDKFKKGELQPSASSNVNGHWM